MQYKHIAYKVGQYGCRLFQIGSQKRGEGGLLESPFDDLGHKGRPYNKALLATDSATAVKGKAGWWEGRSWRLLTALLPPPLESRVNVTV